MKKNYNFYCQLCDFNTCKKSNWDNHILTRKHKMITKNSTKSSSVIINDIPSQNDTFEESMSDDQMVMITNFSTIDKKTQYFCNSCNLNCITNKDYQNHLLTRKHRKNIGEVKNCCYEFECNVCGKNYKYSSGLSRHKKYCIDEELEEEITDIICISDNADDESNTNTNSKQISPELFMKLLEQNMEVLKQNSEFKELLTEQNKVIMELSKNAGCFNNNNNNNKTFNIQMFLNETCKDALSMNEFIDSLKITMDDVERFGTEGFIEGITKIFLKNLKMLDIYKRPVHCSDLKREIIYIKDDNNTWQKDNEEKEVMKKTINKIAHKNFLRIQDWREENPEYKDYDSKVNDKYQKIMFEAMGGYTKEENEKNFAKIIRNVSKQVTIDKSVFT